MSDDNVHEIVIIKRHGGGHEEGHHGGAWKIAYADFVTAMMAFFLVMWLISANDKTKASLTHYFNPVLLVDATTQPPGLTDPKPDASSSMKSNHSPETAPKTPGPYPVDNDPSKEASPQDAKAPPPSDKDKKTEADLFRDPYALLATIASKDSPQPKKPSAKPSADGAKGAAAKGATEGARGGAASNGSAGQKGGEAFRDPFEPQTAEATAPADATEVAPPAPDAPAQPPAADNAAQDATAADAASAPLPAEPQAKAAELGRIVRPAPMRGPPRQSGPWRFGRMCGFAGPMAVSSG